MQRRVMNTVNKFRVGRKDDDEDYVFENCTTLCNVAITTFGLLKDKYAVTELVQVSTILNRLPILAHQKLQEWFPNVDTQPETHAQLSEFATRIDNLYKSMKTTTVVKSILKVDINGYRRTRERSPTPFPRGKRNRSLSSRSPSRFENNRRSPSPMIRSRSPSPIAYRNQSHYKGNCAKCGKIGHSIAQCRFATDDDKKTFFNKVKESKAAANSKNDKKKVRFAKDVKTNDGQTH